MVAVSFIGGGDPEKITACRKSLTIFYQLMLCTSPWEGVETTTSVLIGTDCIGSCKSNYHTIMTTTARCVCVIKGKVVCCLLKHAILLKTKDRISIIGRHLLANEHSAFRVNVRQINMYVHAWSIWLSTILLYGISLLILLSRCRRGRDCMIVGFTSTFAINVHHHYLNEFEFRSGKVYSIPHYMIKFVSDLRQVGDLLLFSPWIKMTAAI